MNRCIRDLLLLGACALAPASAGAQLRAVPARPVAQLLPPGPAPGVTAAATSATTVRLTWTPTPNATGYRVTRLSPAGAPVVLASYPATETALTDAAVLPNTELAYVVTAVYAAAGPGASAPVKVKTPLAPRPAWVRVTTPGLGKVSVEWSAVPGAYAYTVFRDNAFLNAEPVSETSYRDSVPAPGSYTYFVVPIFRMQDYPAPGQVRMEEGQIVQSPSAVANVPRWKGRYRVVVNGFEVHRETIDHALEIDGKKDEVFITTSAQATKNGRVLKDEVRRRTKVFGFVGPTVDNLGASWPGRLQGGSASPQGGLQPGDEIPFGKPWLRSTGAAISEDRLPLHAWTGTLSEAGDGVVITPVIWEWDGAPDLLAQLNNAWPSFYEPLAFRLRDPECAQYLAPFATIDTVLPVAVDVVHELLGKPGDRPIGMTRRNVQSSYTPKPLVLTFREAERLLATATNRGNGIVELRFTEPAGDGLNGDYTLWIQIERIE
jgi:hypothetical protein